MANAVQVTLTQGTGLELELVGKTLPSGLRIAPGDQKQFAIPVGEHEFWLQHTQTGPTWPKPSGGMAGGAEFVRSSNRIRMHFAAGRYRFHCEISEPSPRPQSILARLMAALSSSEQAYLIKLISYEPL